MFAMLSIPPCQELQLVINVVYEPSIGRDTHRELYSQCRVSRNKCSISSSQKNSEIRLHSHIRLLLLLEFYYFSPVYDVSKGKLTLF